MVFVGFFLLRHNNFFNKLCDFTLGQNAVSVDVELSENAVEAGDWNGQVALLLLNIVD